MIRVNTLWLRLAISFLALMLLVIGAVAWIVRGSIESSFGEYVNISNMARFGGDLVSTLEDYYAQNGDWSGVDSLLFARGSGQGEGRGTSGGNGAQVFITDANGLILAATQAEWVGLSAAEIGASRQIDLHADGQVVGRLGEQTPGTVALAEAENRFLQDTTNGLLLTGIIAGTVTFLVSLALAYSLTRPLRHLTDHISRWRLRAESAPIDVQGTDEIQRLGGAFNDLLARLAAGESQRQRMSADVAHELRTPVTVMRGHLEAMMDGVYPLDTAHLAVAYDQVLHLARLVEDLRTLTQAETGRLPLVRARVDLCGLVRAAVDRFAPLTHENAQTVTLDLPDTAIMVNVDPHRLQQVLDNLLSNAVRHTPESGKIGLRIDNGGEFVRVSISNKTEMALNDDLIAHLFDRFWRGEDARARDTGGSGLGLAITRELLRLHGGDIHAERTPDGLQVTFTLPTANF